MIYSTLIPKNVDESIEFEYQLCITLRLFKFYFQSINPKVT